MIKQFYFKQYKLSINLFFFTQFKCQTVLFDPLIEPFLVLQHWAKVDMGVMAMKR